jgi:hypothetical protein
MKLTKESAEKILSSRICDNSQNDVKAIFELLGMKLKEFKETTLEHSMSFEVHYKRTYVIAVHAEADSKLVSFGNEYVNFGGASGISMGIKNVKELLLIVLNMFFVKLHVNYEGIEFKEDGDYADMEEMQEVVNHVNELLSVPVEEEKSGK